jgi:hypothetical protein
MKLIKSLKFLLVAQLVMYGLFMAILYATKNSGNFSGLLAIYPEMAFGVLSIVNLVLILIYVMQVARNKVRFDRFIPITVLVIIVLAVFFVPIANFLDSYN